MNKFFLLILLCSIMNILSSDEVLLYEIRYYVEPITEEEDYDEPLDDDSLFESMTEVEYSQYIDKEKALMDSLWEEEVKENRTKNYEYYENLKWGWDPSSKIAYNTDKYKEDRNILAYNIVRSCNLEEFNPYSFQRVANDSILLPNYAMIFGRWAKLTPIKSFTSFDQLYIEDCWGQEVLFKKEKRFRNHYGDCYFTRDYNETEFFDHKFNDISEFYLNLEGDYGIYEYLLWFDSDYNLVRLDLIHGEYCRGMLIIKE